MKYTIYLLFILTFCSVLPAHAEVLITSSDGKTTKMTTLAEAAASTDTAVKTVVVNSPQNLSTSIVWPAGKTLLIEQGGLLIIPFGESLTVNGNFSAGLHNVFAGEGTVTFGEGSVTGVYPEWWGAVAGTGKSSKVRKANLSAINNAWIAIKSKVGGLLHIDNTYEVTGGSVLLGSKTTPPLDSAGAFIRPVIKGNGAISSFHTGIAVDAVGMRFTTIEGITIESNSATVGLLMGRSSGSGTPGVAGAGADRSDGSYNSISRLRIMGRFSNANLITVNSEANRWIDCWFYNIAENAALYRSSENKDIVGVESIEYGPMWAYTTTTGASLVDYKVHPAKYVNPTATNTEQKFIGCQFMGYATGQDIIQLTGEFSGVFESCHFTSGSANGVNLVKFIAEETNIRPYNFGWGTTFSNCHFEIFGSTTLPSNIFYFDYIGNESNYIFMGINIINPNIATLARFISYRDVARTDLRMSAWLNFYRYNNGAIDPIVLPNTYHCNIDIPNSAVLMSGSHTGSKIRAKSIAWGAGIIGVLSTVEDMDSGTIQYGVVPAATSGTTNNYASASYRSRLVIAPVIDRNKLLSDPMPHKGELISFDSAAVFPGVSTKSGVNMGFFAGTDFVPLGVYPSNGSITPSSSCVANTVVYDAKYLYVCTATGTDGNLGVVTGSISAASKHLTISSGSIKVGSYINIDGVTGIKRVETASGTAITLDSVSDETVTNRAVTYAVAAWKRVAISSW